MLDQPFNLAGSYHSVDFGDNYKMGIDFSIPLFLRRERAKVAQTKLKINATTIERDFTTRQVTNDINTAHNYLLNNALLLAQQQSMVENYERLVNAELFNLANGESDLFKINVQQEKLFQSQSKLLKVMSEHEKQKAVLYWAAGLNPISR